MMYDYVLIGGGLQNGLIALALRHLRPETSIALIERGPALGGNHTWSFHEGDVAEEARPFVAPLIEHRWPGYEVSFPGLRRSIELPYATFRSPRLDEVVRRRLGPRDRLLLGAAVSAATAREALLADQGRVEGRVVIDARGPAAPPLGAAPPAGSGFLKFLGLEVKLAAPAGLSRPVLMDATVRQRDGFRFFYVLPLSPDHLLVEDNYYSDDDRLDRQALLDGVRGYCAQQGWAIRQTLREEHGVLPLPLREGRAVPADDGPFVAGYRGGLYHPATSYSFPVALRLACLVARTPIGQLREALAAFLAEHRRQARFCHRLNWLLFRGSPAPGRWRILRGFYRHPEQTLQRFYALTLTAGDRARILRRGALHYLGALLSRGAPQGR